MLDDCRNSIERFVKFRLPSPEDAEDVLQEIYLTAYLKFGQLKNTAAFKSWILRIAQNCCNDYYRRAYRNSEISIDSLPESALVCGRQGLSVRQTVAEVMAQLDFQDRQILSLYFWQELPQAQIATRLGIPLGTVKSRLHHAKHRFEAHYPYPPARKKGDISMTKLPAIMPKYTIKKLDLPAFEVRWEELQGWMIVPRLGEKLSWGLYESPSGQRTEYTEMKVTGKAEIHGIEGVEILAVQYGAEDYYRTGCIDKIQRHFVAQLTDTHCRYLAESHMEDGIRKCYTFLDGESFLNNWGFGEDNCGNEVALTEKGLIRRDGKTVTGQVKQDTVDIVGRYAVTIGEKVYDTVCVMDIQCFNDGVVSEQYLDRNGRTVLWRRFNKDDWALEHFGGNPWSQQLPGNEQLTVNGDIYVHWYDCLSDYVL